jgi:hypothetical protein
VRPGYRYLQYNSSLYPSQVLYNMWAEADEEEELDAIHQHLLRHGAFRQSEYMDLQDLFMDEDTVQGPYNERGMQKRIDAYFDWGKGRN